MALLVSNLALVYGSLTPVLYLVCYDSLCEELRAGAGSLCSVVCCGKFVVGQNYGRII